MAICPACHRTYPNASERCEVDGTTLVPHSTFAAVDVDLPPGEMVGEYRVERTIGRGSFGVVYGAIHPVIGKHAAVKILTRECSANPLTVSRFIAEARAVNQIRHRNIVDIFSFGALADGRQYHVMELLEGEPLDRYLARTGPLSPEEALPIFERIGKALDAAHTAGIVHRDLKPANVFLAVDDEGGRFPKLLDFGIAKLLRGSEQQAAERTRTGAPIGTPFYMSPEQCRGDVVDHRTNVYAFGVMVFEVLTGRVPFEEESVLKVMMKHVSGVPPRMSSVNPRLPTGLDGPVLSMLEKEPRQRPETLAHAVAALARAAGLESAARPPISGAGVTPYSPRPVAPREGERAAETAVANAHQTLGPQTVSTRPPRAVVALVTLLALGAASAILAALAFRGLHGAAAAGPEVGHAPSAGRAPVGPEATGAVPPASEPGRAGRVRFALHSVPPTAEPTLDGHVLGVMNGELELRRGATPITLVFRAPGYQPKSVEVTPIADGKLDVTLLPAPRRAPARPGSKASGDLEF